MRKRSSSRCIPPYTFALPSSSRLPSCLWQADSRHWPLTLCLLSREKVTVYVYVSVWVCWCVHIFCVQESLCTGCMCLNCQQREYTAKNKNSSVSIQRVCVCLCVCVSVFCACIYVSLCDSVWSGAGDREVYLVYAANGDKRHTGLVRGGGRSCWSLMWRNIRFSTFILYKQWDYIYAEERLVVSNTVLTQ